MDPFSISDISNLVVFQPITTGIVLAAILAAFLLLLSGFASGSEIAFFSLSPQDLDEQSWYQYINQDDPVIGTAINVFREGKAFPSIVKKKAKK